MLNEKLYKGYHPNFLSDGSAALIVDVPQLNQEQLDDVVYTTELMEPLLNYINYSIQLSSAHKFPYYTASNIDGKLFKKVPRTDNWRKDPRISADAQWGEELDGKLYRVAFMMSQNRLMMESGMIKGLALKFAEENLFMQFDDAETYQVNISLVETFSGLTMPAAIDSYTDERSTKLVLEEIDVDPEARQVSAVESLGFVIRHLTL